jgi:hypothetical protein
LVAAREDFGPQHEQELLESDADIGVFEEPKTMNRRVLRAIAVRGSTAVELAAGTLTANSPFIIPSVRQPSGQSVDYTGL